MSFPSSFCYPKSTKCAFWDDYQEDRERLMANIIKKNGGDFDKYFCSGCEHLIRDNEYDEGSRRTGYLEAFVCELDSMNPEIYYTEPEPNMPWE